MTPTTSTPDTPGTTPLAGDHYFDALGTVTVWDEDRRQWVRGAIVPEGSAPRPAPRPPARPAPRPSRTAQALALLVVAALGVLALSAVAALVVLIWRAVL